MSSNGLLYSYDDFVFFDKDKEVGILYLENGQELGTYPHVDGEIRAIQSYKDRVIVGFSNSELVCYSILCKLVMWQCKLQPGAKEGEGGFVDLMMYSPGSSNDSNSSSTRTSTGSSSSSPNTHKNSSPSLSSPSSSTPTTFPIKHDTIIAYTRKSVFGVNPISGEIKFKIDPTDTLSTFSPHDVSSEKNASFRSLSPQSMNEILDGVQQQPSSTQASSQSPQQRNSAKFRKSNSTTNFLNTNNMKLHSESIYQVKIHKNQLIVVCGISEDQDYVKFYPTSIVIFLLNRLRLRVLNVRKRRRKIPELESLHRLDLEERLGSITNVGVYDRWLYLTDEISLYRFPLSPPPQIIGGGGRYQSIEIKSRIIEESEHANSSSSANGDTSPSASPGASTGMKSGNINLNVVIDGFTGGHSAGAYQRPRSIRDNTNNNNNTLVTPIVYNNMITCLEVDAHYLIVGMQNNMFYCFHRESFELLWKKQHRVSHVNSATSASTNPSATGASIANGPSSSPATNTAGGATTAAALTNQEEARGITSIRIFASQGIVFTSSANDHMIRSWKLRDHGREAFFLNSHVLGCGVTSLKLLPRGSFGNDSRDRLLSIGQDKFIRYWDIAQNIQIWSTYTSGVEVFAMEYYRDHLYLGANCLQGQGVGVATRNGFGNKRQTTAAVTTNVMDDVDYMSSSQQRHPDQKQFSNDSWSTSEGYEIQKWSVNHELAKNQLKWSTKLPHNSSRPVSFAFTAQLVFVGTTSGRFYAIYEDSGIIAFHILVANEPVVRMLATESIVISITKKGDIPTLIDGWDIETHTISASDWEDMKGRNTVGVLGWSQQQQDTRNANGKNLSVANVNAVVNAIDSNYCNSTQLLAKCENQLWRNHIPNYEQFTSLTENEKLLVVSDTNDVIMIDIRTGHTIAEVNCHSRITGLKTMEENHLLVALADGNIYSIGGKSANTSLFSVMGSSSPSGLALAEDDFLHGVGNVENNGEYHRNPHELPTEMYNVKRMFSDYLHPTKFMIFMNVMTSSKVPNSEDMNSSSVSGHGGSNHSNGGLQSPYGSPMKRGFSSSSASALSPSRTTPSFSNKPAKLGEQLLILCSNNLVRCCRYDEFSGIAAMMMINANHNSTNGFLWHTIIDPSQPLDADVIRYAFKFHDDMVIIVKGKTVLGLSALDGSIVFQLQDDHGHPIDQSMIITENFLCISTIKELKAYDMTMLRYLTVPCCVFDLANDLMEIREGRRGKLIDISNTTSCACCSSNASNINGMATDEENCCCSCQCSHTIATSCSSPLFARSMAVLRAYRNMIALLLQIVFFLVETLQLFSFAFARVERGSGGDHGGRVVDYQRFQVVLEGFQKLLSSSSASYDYGSNHETILYEVYVYICWGIMLIFILCIVIYEWLAWRAFKAPTSMYPKWTAIAGCCTDIITGPLLIPLLWTTLSTVVCVNHDILRGALREERNIQCSSNKHIGLVVPSLILLLLFCLTSVRLKRVKNRMDAIQMNLFDVRRVQVIKPVRTHPLTYSSHFYLMLTLSISICFVVIELFANAEVAVVLNMALALAMLANATMFPPFPDLNSNRLAILVNVVMTWHFMIALISQFNSANENAELVTYGLLWAEFIIFVTGLFAIIYCRKQFQEEQVYENEDLIEMMLAADRLAEAEAAAATLQDNEDDNSGLLDGSTKDKDQQGGNTSDSNSNSTLDESNGRKCVLSNASISDDSSIVAASAKSAGRNKEQPDAKAILSAHSEEDPLRNIM